MLNMKSSYLGLLVLEYTMFLSHTFAAVVGFPKNDSIKNHATPINAIII